MEIYIRRLCFPSPVQALLIPFMAYCDISSTMSTCFPLASSGAEILSVQRISSWSIFFIPASNGFHFPSLSYNNSMVFLSFNFPIFQCQLSSNRPQEVGYNFFSNIPQYLQGMTRKNILTRSPTDTERTNKSLERLPFPTNH